jgi:hypothetical protein
MNVHLGIYTMALASGSCVSSFFGMNLVSGLEEAQFAFPIVVALSSFTGGGMALYALNYLSGRTMRKRAESRLQEIEALNAALSDMGALDYTVRRGPRRCATDSSVAFLFIYTHVDIFV